MEETAFQPDIPNSLLVESPIHGTVVPPVYSILRTCNDPKTGS